jgi:hypothetical protein
LLNCGLSAFAKDFFAAHVGDVLEAYFDEFACFFQAVGYSGCEFIVCSFEDGFFDVYVD